MKKLNGITSDAEGNVYIADTENHRIRKINRDGIITTVAGNGTAGYGGDNGPATEALLNLPIGVAIDSLGNLFIADTGNNLIRKVDANGTITTIAGTGVSGFSGDNNPALLALLDTPYGISVGKNGDIFIADTGNSRIRKITPNGIIYTVAGTGEQGYTCDNCVARESALYFPTGVAVDKDGNIFIADTWNHRIRKVDVSGIISTVAGNGVFSFSGDGALASEASIYNPTNVAVDEEGNLYISDAENNRIRKVDVEGFIHTIAGDGGGGIQFGVSPKESSIESPRGVTVDPEGNIYFSVTYPYYYSTVVEIGSSQIADLISGDGQGYVDPSGETYIIRSGNLHTATINSFNHTPIRYFSYDSQDRLIAVFDRAQNMSYIERLSDGTPTAIISPDGIRTELTVDDQNRLVRVTYPDNSFYAFEYNNGALMIAETDPNGNSYEHVFNQDGRITDASDPEGGHWHYDVINNVDGSTRTELATAEGQLTVYLDQLLSSGEFTLLMTKPDGGTTEYVESEDGMLVNKSMACGTKELLAYGLDPSYRFEYLKSKTVTLPSGITKTLTEDRVYEDFENDMVHEKVTSTITMNGKEFVLLTDKTVTTESLTTPEGRTFSSGYDSTTGLTTWSNIPGLFQTDYTYDERGRLAEITRGIRKSTLSYDLQGNLATVTDPENRTTYFNYDAMGRMTRILRPDTSTVGFSYDKNGNITVLTNPFSINHGFGYNSVNSNTAYYTPLSGPYTYIYDRDRRLSKTILPSGSEINNIYDGGRLTRTETPEGNINYSYLTCGSLLSSVTKGTEGIAYSYDGSLLTEKTYSGTLNTVMSMTYNNDFDVNTFSYAGDSEAFTYDNDGLLTGAGRFTISRNSENGLPESVTSESFALSRAFNGYGEVEVESVSVEGLNRSTWSLARNNNGRIVTKTETINGVTAEYSYTYDLLGSLLTVSKDGFLQEEYQYNANGARVYEMNNLIGINGRILTYSNEDHLLTAGNISYSYSYDGFLETRTEGFDVTSYDYSSRGELLSVSLPDSTLIEYIHDPKGKRIAKKVNGVVVEKYLWQDLTRLLAMYDGNDNLLQRFEYADGRMPYAMTSGGVTYYLSYDQVGSLRLVVDASGNVIKQVDYDSFGNIISDSNEAFKVPFGFAGGLHDRDTGLVRFGYRDYMPEIGRWTAKDPILFAGGDTDLYGYVRNDPVNLVDPKGLESAGICIAKCIAKGVSDIMDISHASYDLVKCLNKAYSTPCPNLGDVLKCLQDWLDKRFNMKDHVIKMSNDLQKCIWRCNHPPFIAPDPLPPNYA